MTKRIYNKSEADLVRCIECIRAVYASPNGGAGCCLHVLVDDGNYNSAAFVLGAAEAEGHPACVEAARLLASFSPTRRAKACRLAKYG